jgi:Sensors of blue-light using FAD
MTRMLVRLLYASRCAEPVTQPLIDNILAQSRSKNPGLGITGLLCHGGEVFMQVLEGGRAQVNGLYSRIQTDPRHRDVQVLHFEEATERRFAAWTMGQVNLAKVNPSIVLKYSERPVLEPFAVSGRVSMALLEELIATASIIGRAG